MTGFPLARAAAVLALAGLAAMAGPVAAPAGAAGARPGPPVPAARTAPGTAGWQVRTVLPERARARSAAQVISTFLGMDFSLVPVNRPATRFQLRRTPLSVVPLNRPIFGWAMYATTVSDGSLWLARQDGVIGCVGPQTGRVKARATLLALRDSGQLLTVSPYRHLVYALGRDGVVAITAPAACWG